MASQRRHRGDGRQRGRDRRVDARSRERARRTRRHARPASSAAPEEAVEAAGHEVPADLDAPVADDTSDSGVRRVAPERVPRTRRRPARAGIGARLRGVEMTPAGLATLVITVVVVCVVALTLAMPLRTYFSQRSEFRQLTASNEQLQREVADYQQKVNEQNDPAYIEAQARTRLQFVKPGEIPLVMLFPADEARREAAERAEERARAPWYGNLWDTLSTPPGVQ
ncbi:MULTISPECIES: septum formation initiator family protein [unclassified Gordonia (in: high G+C Gram-positive bacteria)]|uniref:septum formation initiator family protein n=1 Tax=unclassified Gordonia (in: high G+C Gram-positive bacteria) TaxID=2657482 RepID=UPI00071DCC32|nr:MULTISPECIES: septum formation initiator family protein [unclassified Gordonia (in: high G+C Gram-positive bacteria)]KSU59681.1 septum formation initiator [Gordonia sp. SGD-V-85]MBR7190886.1 septum formation initiator family protein [Gordonia sp. SCSIO 19800]MCX2752955.1 septum formation initiator family protein [Gordonia sp. 4N]MDT0223077.1 septum formation initiator family protein [Gordonia sp. AC31]